MALNLNLRAKRSDLEQAYSDRLSEANFLLAGGYYATAIATALYALEICLKVKICQRLDLAGLPTAFEFHNFPELLTLTGLSRRMTEVENSEVSANWNQVIAYGPKHINDLRYLPASKSTETNAVDIMRWLQNEADGVLPWLYKQE